LAVCEIVNELPRFVKGQVIFFIMWVTSYSGIFSAVTNFVVWHSLLQKFQCPMFYVLTHSFHRYRTEYYWNLFESVYTLLFAVVVTS
jgi:hypothetical protein